jgi:hypothetical protein
MLECSLACESGFAVSVYTDSGVSPLLYGKCHSCPLYVGAATLVIIWKTYLQRMVGMVWVQAGILS